MRVRMKSSISGTVDGLYLPPRNTEVDVPDHVGADLCASDLAEPVAVVEPVETAVMPDEGVEKRAEPEAEVSELDALRAKAEAMGVKVDGRWGADRLREAIAAAAP